MIIRKASVSDVTGIVPLMADLGYPLPENVLADRLKVYTTSDIYSVFVAEVNTTIVGFVASSISEMILCPGKRCHVEALFVQREHRGNGLGRRLMEAAEQYAKKHGCITVDLTSGVRRAKDGSHDFYRHLGYSDSGHLAKLYFRKEL